MPEAEGRAYIHNAYLAGHFSRALDLVEDNCVITDVDGISVVRVTLVNADKAGTLPTASANKDRILEFILVATGTGDFDVTPEGTETIGGYNAVFKLNAAGQRVRVQSDGSGWEILDCLGTLLEFTSTAVVTITSPQNVVWYNPTSHQLEITPGYWLGKYKIGVQAADAASIGIYAFTTLSTTNNGETDTTWSASGAFFDDHAAANLTMRDTFAIEDRLIVPVTDIFYLNIKGASNVGGALTQLVTLGTVVKTLIQARRIG